MKWHEHVLKANFSGRSNANVWFSNQPCLIKPQEFRDRVCGSNHVLYRKAVWEVVSGRTVRGCVSQSGVRVPTCSELLES